MMAESHLQKLEAGPLLLIGWLERGPPGQAFFTSV